MATPQEVTDLVDSIREHLPSKDTKQLRSIVTCGLMKARGLVIAKKGAISYRCPIGDPNGETHERKKERWEENNTKQQELAQIDNHMHIQAMALYEAILTDAETKAVVDGILSSSFGGSCSDYGLACVIVRFLLVMVFCCR